MTADDQLFGELTGDAVARVTGQLSIRVVGLPAPQGSKRAILHKSSGRPIVVESSKRVGPWREAVKFAALEARERRGQPRHQTFTEPLAVDLVFRLVRPKGHYGTGRNAAVVKPKAPRWPWTKPDLDKLIRSTLDALKDAGVYRDDALIVQVVAQKVYADAELAGADIIVSVLQ